MDVLIVRWKGSVILLLALIMGVSSGTIYAGGDEAVGQKLTVEEKLKLYNISRELDENPRRAPRKQVSKADIENEVAKFQEFDAGMKARAAGSNNALIKSAAVSRVDTDLENRYMKDGKYILNIFYYNDADYSKKSSESTTFTENDSDLFYSQASERIFSELLGDGYEKYEPKLRVVSEEYVGIKLLFSNSTELEKFISNPLVESKSHVGNPRYTVTTTP